MVSVERISSHPGRSRQIQASPGRGLTDLLFCSFVHVDQFSVYPEWYSRKPMLKISHILLPIKYTTSCCHCYYQLLLGTTAATTSTATATYHCAIIGLSQEAFPASRQEEALQHLSYAENRFSRGELSFPPLPLTLMPRSSFSREELSFPHFLLTNAS